MTELGEIVTDLEGNDLGNSVTLQADGKILVAGYSNNGSISSFALVRYNANGSLDISFDSDGKVITDFGTGIDYGYSVTVQADGKILVAGYMYNGSTSDFALVRYNADGSLDTSFDSDGMVTTDFGGEDGGKSVTMQADGKILLAGQSYNTSSGSNSNFALARYNANGSLDTSFDSDGLIITDFSTRSDYGKSVIAQADGKILVVGTSYDRNYDFALVRYNANGSLDTSFDSDGKVTTDFGTNDFGNSGIVQADGKILVAGFLGDISPYITNNKVTLARYNTDGSLDTSFDSDGMIITDFSTASCDYNSVTVQADGKILAAGYMYNGSTIDFALVRYNADGSLDTSFDSDGMAFTDFDLSNEAGKSVTIQADGKILVAGYMQNGSTTDFALVRYNIDGSLDTSFGGSGGDATTATILSGTSVNDIIHSGVGNEIMDGGAGVDTAIYSCNHSDCTISKTATGFTLTGGGNGTDTLSNIERLQFADCCLALDLDGNAGSTAKILGAVFGSASVSNKTYAGIGIGLLDGGMSYEDLTALAVNAAGASTPEQVVNLLWTNVVGSAPSVGQAQPFVDMLNGSMTIGQLGVLAADTDINQTNINMLGLMQTGLEYV